MPQSCKIRVNRSPARDEFLPRESDREGRLGFGWTDKKPYGVFQRSAYLPQNTNNGPDYDASGYNTNNGPYGSSVKRVGLGYQPDLPDMRDYVIDRGDWRTNSAFKQTIVDMITAIQQGNGKTYKGKESKKSKGSSPLEQVAPSYLLDEAGGLPTRCDLRATGHLSPVEDQGAIGSCTAQAVVGLIEYLMRAGGGDGKDMSRLFVYKLSRRLLGWEGDTGAYIRTAIKSIAMFGLPPENEWPYDVTQYDEEPLAYHFAYAQNFKATTYARLDGYGDGDATLDSVKRCLQDGFPTAFGFPVYSSIDSVGVDGNYVIPTPGTRDSLRGGHAVLAVGYDDDLKTDVLAGSANTRGALLIRNSWGLDWGLAGYAYLPYEYVRRMLAVDFWTVFNKNWIKPEIFE